MSSTLGREAQAHPIHTTLTAVTVTPEVTTVSIRVFDDDFSASVARFVGKPTPRDSTVQADDAWRYVAAHFGLANAAGRPVAITSCGLRREAGLYWVCLQVQGPPAPAGTSLRNAMLMDRHADQVNIIQIVRGRARRTILLTRGSTTTPLD